jgi:cytochrome c oxidase subunit 3
MNESPRIVGDLAQLPTYAFGARSLTWWGVLGFVAIEGIALALACGTYLYLYSQEPEWPPPPALPPPLLYASAFTMLLLASEVLNTWIKHAAEAERLREVRAGLVGMVGIGAALLALRALELHAVNVWWDQNAYGSVVWTLLFLHTLHLATDYADSLVLTALMFTGHGNEGRRFVDCSENAFYWRFVVLIWLPVYALVYWAPRLSAS